LDHNLFNDLADRPIATQLYWINNALGWAKNSSTTGQPSRSKEPWMNSHVKRGETCDANCGCLQTPIGADSMFVNLDPAKMDSILKIHFAYHGLQAIMDLE
jgi:hypothetical protein